MDRSCRLPVIVLLGPPGAGKGMQAKLLEDRFSLVPLSRVELVREAIALRTAPGLMAQAMMEAGDPVSKEIALEILAQRISEPDCAAGVTLVGLPGEAAEAAALDARLRRMGARVSAAICVDLADEVIVERISGRHTCEKCGERYHDTCRPPTVNGACDNCRHTTFRRWAEDRADAVRQRLAQHHAAALPVIDYYHRRGVLTRIDAAGPLNAVTTRLRDVIRPIVTDIWHAQSEAQAQGPAFRPLRSDHPSAAG